MSYIALRYVGKYTPGEVIPELSEEAAERLIRIGAVKELEGQGAFRSPPATPSGEPSAGKKAKGKAGSDGNAENAEPDERSAGEEPEPEYFVEREEEPLEIDVTDAVIPAETPKKKTSRKKTAKKEA